MVRQSRLARSSHAGVLRHLRDVGLRPATLIDVGAARGDWAREAARVFPNAQLVLVEPLSEFANDLRGLIGQHRNVIIVEAAARATPGEARLNVHRDLVGSSLLPEAGDTNVDGAPRIVPTATIDQIVMDHRAEPPYLIKIDVQGAELEVLAGAARVVGRADGIIVEASLLPFFDGGPVLAEVIDWLGGRGFVVFDIFGATYRPLDGALAQVDLVLVPKDSPLRRDARYATSTQRKDQDAVLLRELGRSRQPGAR